MVAIINDKDVKKWREAAQDMHEEIVKWMNLSIRYENMIRELELKLESTTEENNSRLINENGSSNSNKKMGDAYDECDLSFGRPFHESSLYFLGHRTIVVL